MLRSGQLKFAEKPEDLKFLEERGHAKALLLSHGKVLVHKDLKSDPAGLLRAITHEEAEAMMQIMAREDRVKYSTLVNIILESEVRLPEGKPARLRDVFGELFPSEAAVSGSGGFTADELLANHIAAKAVELVTAKNDGLLAGRLSRAEERFLAIASQLTGALRHSYFTGEFMEDSTRKAKIRTVMANGFSFEQAAGKAGDNESTARALTPQPQAPQPQARAPGGDLGGSDLGAQVSDGKYLRLLSRAMGRITGGKPLERIKQKWDTEADIMDKLIDMMEALSLASIVLDEDGNRVVTIDDAAAENLRRNIKSDRAKPGVLRVIDFIQRKVIRPGKGVKAVNYYSRSKGWTIVCFKAQSDSLEHERREVALRRSGIHWLVSHILVSRNLDKGNRRTVQKIAREIAEELQMKNGEAPDYELGAAFGSGKDRAPRRTIRALLSELKQGMERRKKLRSSVARIDALARARNWPSVLRELMNLGMLAAAFRYRFSDNNNDVIARLIAMAEKRSAAISTSGSRSASQTQTSGGEDYAEAYAASKTPPAITMWLRDQTRGIVPRWIVALAFAPAIEEILYRGIPVVIAAVFLQITPFRAAQGLWLLASVPIQIFAAIKFMADHRREGETHAPMRKKAVPALVVAANGIALPLILSGAFYIPALNISDPAVVYAKCVVVLHSLANLAAMLINLAIGKDRNHHLRLSVTERIDGDPGKDPEIPAKKGLFDRIGDAIEGMIAPLFDYDLPEMKRLHDIVRNIEDGDGRAPKDPFKSELPISPGTSPAAEDTARKAGSGEGAWSDGVAGYHPDILAIRPVQAAEDLNVPRIEITAPAGDSGREKEAFIKSVKGLEEASWRQFGSRAAEAEGRAAGMEKRGQSLILYSDDIVKNAMIVDLEHTVKNVLSKHGVLSGGKIILYSNSPGSSLTLESIIRIANPSIEVVKLSPGDLQITGDESKRDEREAAALLRAAGARGAKEILALIRGPSEQPEGLAELAGRSRVPIVIVGLSEGVYSFAQAVSMAIDVKSHDGASAFGRNGWLIALPAVKPLTEEIRRNYEEYLRSLPALAAA
jgi:hypothetical protein